MKATETGNADSNGVYKPRISPCDSLVDRSKKNPASAFRSAVSDQNMIKEIDLCLSRAEKGRGFFVGIVLKDRPVMNLWLSMAEALKNNFAYFGRALQSDPPKLQAIPERAHTLAQTVWCEESGKEIRSGFAHSIKFNEMVIAPLVYIFKYLSKSVLVVSRVRRDPCEEEESRVRVSDDELISVAKEVGFAKYKIACWLANWAAMVEFENSVKEDINEILRTVEDSVMEMDGARDGDIQDALIQYRRGQEVAGVVEDMRIIFDNVEDGAAEEKSTECHLFEGISSPFSGTGSEASETGLEASETGSEASETGSEASEIGSEASETGFEACGSSFLSGARLDSRDASHRSTVARYAMRLGLLGAGDRVDGEGRPSKFRKVDLKLVCPSDIDRDIRMTSNDVGAVDFGQFALKRGMESQKQQEAILEKCRQLIGRIDFINQSGIKPQFEVLEANTKRSKKKGKSSPAPISAEVIGKWPKVKGGAGVLVSQEQVDNGSFPKRRMTFSE